MEPTGQLITSPLDIPAGAMPHGDIQAAAEIDFATLEALAAELESVKLPVRTLSRVGWFYTTRTARRHTFTTLGKQKSPLEPADPS
ncbi:hypothetical protein [Scrofimicrobium sp. R131]|uniref:Uncharacterized protein n=1 Tax=Scrofimicrobium appendicitidis TaxID=3079930 RepID=A0AAU7V9Y4_9ACTO